VNLDAFNSPIMWPGLRCCCCPIHDRPALVRWGDDLETNRSLEMPHFLSLSFISLLDTEASADGENQISISMTP